MDRELNALLHTKTWELVDPPKAGRPFQIVGFFHMLSALKWLNFRREYRGNNKINLRAILQLEAMSSDAVMGKTRFG